jgi:hypothetical protein
LARKDWPRDVEAQILTKSRRICAFCFYFADDRSVKMRGQIAHIDRDPSNAAVENGAYLCKDHHDEYDMTSNQSKRISPAELEEARALVYEFLQSGGLPVSGKKSGKRAILPGKKGVSLAVYERRIPIYRTAVDFIRYVVGDARPEYPQIFQFGRDTEEALFLFDESIARYLRELSNRAARLHAVEKMRGSAAMGRGGDFQSLIAEETELVLWFTEQYDEARRLLAPFLRLEA